MVGVKSEKISVLTAVLTRPAAVLADLIGILVWLLNWSISGCMWVRSLRNPEKDIFNILLLSISGLFQLLRFWLVRAPFPGDRCCISQIFHTVFHPYLYISWSCSSISFYTMLTLFVWRLVGDSAHIPGRRSTNSTRSSFVLHVHEPFDWQDPTDTHRSTWTGYLPDIVY